MGSSILNSRVNWNLSWYIDPSEDFTRYRTSLFKEYLLCSVKESESILWIRRWLLHGKIPTRFHSHTYSVYSEMISFSFLFSHEMEMRWVDVFTPTHRGLGNRQVECHVSNLRPLEIYVNTIFRVLVPSFSSLQRVNWIYLYIAVITSFRSVDL